MLPLVDRLPKDKVIFDGLGGDVLLKGLFLARNNLMHAHDLRKLASILHRQMRTDRIAPDIISDFFYSPVRERLRSDPYSLLEELSRLGEHENIITLFFIENRTRNAISLLSNNIVGSRAPVIFPFLDNDLVEFSLSIPPLMKIESRIYFRILKQLFPDIMRIPSPNFHLQSDLKESAIRHLLLFVMQRARYAVDTRISHTRRRLQRQALGYLLGLIGLAKSPPFVNVHKVRDEAKEWLRRGKDPSPFVVAMAEFCTWYNRYFHDEALEDNT